MNSSNFQHERLRLSDRSIRLVQIHGSSAGPNDVLSLRITQFAKHKRPPYAAISYTWGSASDLRSIRINGRPFRVHANLWHLLQHLRQRGESRFLWVDALCIDQAHLPERNFHVQLMGQIYEDAEYAIVWLGTPNEERSEARAMEFVREMAEWDVKRGKRGGSWKDVYLNSKTKARWINLLRFCELRYWTRCWIIQEFLQAKRIEVLCGTGLLEWMLFDKVFLDVRQLKTYPEGLKDELDALMRSVPGRLTARRLLHKTSRLEELLSEFYDAQCSEPRDKVYGLLGIAEDCGEPTNGGGAFRGPIPDYGVHLVQVWFEVISYLRDLEPTRLIRPMTASLLQNSLTINAATITNHLTHLDPDASRLALLTSFHLSPDYISPITDTIQSWTSTRDLRQKLETTDFSPYVGWQVSRPTSSHRPSISSQHNRSSSLSLSLHRTSSPKPTVASLPSDLISNTIAFADTSTLLPTLYNYPETTSFHLPLELLSMHPADKQAISNPTFNKPTLIFESNSTTQPLRLGFACTNVRKGDFVIQFQGLDIALIARRNGYAREGMRVIGRAVMITHEGVREKEAAVHPGCRRTGAEGEGLISACLPMCEEGEDVVMGSGIETDCVSLFEMLREDG